MTSDPNYITPAGARRLSEELRNLRVVERPKTVREVQEAAAQGDRSENAEYIYGKKRLREIDRRMRFLTKRLSVAVVVDPAERRGDRAFFGAWVTAEDEDGKQSRWQIVGEDESDGATGKISWRSPIGRALLGKRAGDAITVRRPAGEMEFAILAVEYVGAAPGDGKAEVDALRLAAVEEAAALAERSRELDEQDLDDDDP